MLQLQLHFLLLFVGAAALIPREKFISDAAGYASPKLSPDGKMLGYISSDSNKVKNVFIWNMQKDGLKRQVTFESRNVKGFYWTAVENIIIFWTDRDGDEKNMLYKQNISEIHQERSTITDKVGVKAFIAANNLKEKYVIVGINDETPNYFNAYKFDLLTNELSLVFKNTRFGNFHCDNHMRIRIAVEKQQDGVDVYYRYRFSPNANIDTLTSESDQWEEYIRVSPEDVPITKVIGFDNNVNIYWIWGQNSNFGNLILTSIHDFSLRKILYKTERAAISSILHHLQDHSLLAITEYYHKPEMVVLDQTVAGDIQYLNNFRPDEAFRIISTTQDMETWLVEYISSEHPNEVFVYRRSLQNAQFLFTLNRELERYTLSKQIGFDFVARDGLTIQAYLSLPPQAQLKRPADVSKENYSFAQVGMIPTTPQKMVLYVHGGPHHRDEFGFDTYNALLTDRGYAVLQVNFRGSTGFGKDFTNAGNGEWSRKMHTDLLDAVDFAVEKGIANRSEVAILGTSYGGYAALVGLTFTPDVFACGLDIVGPSNLITLLNSLPDDWLPFLPELIKWTGGDPNTEIGRQELMARSPFFFANNVKKPILIMQGENDPRVKQNESEQIVKALHLHSIPYTYVHYPDEGHGFTRVPNRLAEFGFVEKFLHECLGGEYQPFEHGQYDESAIVQELSLEDFAAIVSDYPRA